MAEPNGRPVVVFTVGHSARCIDEFVELLKVHSIRTVVDVRTIPKSRHNPQFNIDVLPGSLAGESIGYVHLTGLGGLRHARHDSTSTGWRNASFRGFADYMQTPEFRTALNQLIELGNHESVVIMCAEAVPWRCHRSLIADALSIRGIEVREIISLDNVRIHKLTSWANVNGQEIVYPSIADRLGRNVQGKLDLFSSARMGLHKSAGILTSAVAW